MPEFTPIASTIGGVLIGFAAAMLLSLSGRICGVSGIAGGLFRSEAGGRGWRLAFLGGLLVGGVYVPLFADDPFGPASLTSLPVLAIAGLLVGIGTQLGGGCTSGHGVCGISRLSMRSIVATIIFMGVAALTVFIARHVAGGS